MNSVLIVDDNIQNCYLLESILKGSGYKVIIARNGLEAFDLAKFDPPDVIVSDILMPVMDGFELCRRCKEDEVIYSIPFIFYTATYTEPKDEKFALSLGADRFVIKPQKPEILEKIILETLEKSVNREKIYPSIKNNEESDYLRQYNEVLFNKLEKKVSQLENEIFNRTLAEKKISQLNNELESRVRERTMQLENAMQELESFSYSISHDLKSPLRHISSFALMLKEVLNESLDENGKHYLDVIIESSSKMKKLIEDLLYFSRIGQREMIKQFVDLNRLVASVLNDSEMERQGRNISFNVSTLPVVKADSSMLRIVYTNMISNAVKFTSKKEQAVINIGFGEDDQDYILFVQDNGVGFDMKYSSKLFGVFRRLHNESDYEGTGIGLAIVRQIIKKHGGKTWAEGEPERGAIFYFNLSKNGEVNA